MLAIPFTPKGGELPSTRMQRSKALQELLGILGEDGDCRTR